MDDRQTRAGRRKFLDRSSNPAVARSLAALLVLLALICVWLAWAWKREHDAARCWRRALEADDTVAVASGECGGG
jgi:hypothetical protein